MLRLRQYKSCDAEKIVTWFKDETAFRKWSSDRFGDYPITSDMLNDKYIRCNGDCPDEDNFYPLTAFDENGVVGSLIMRFVDDSRSVLRFGFVIVDDSLRGKGCGKQMLLLALKYAFELLKVEKVTLGVFENNMPAYHCYRAVGFRDVDMPQKVTCELFGELWSILELEISREDYEGSRCD